MSRMQSRYSCGPGRRVRWGAGRVGAWDDERWVVGALVLVTRRTRRLTTATPRTCIDDLGPATLMVCGWRVAPQQRGLWTHARQPPRGARANHGAPARLVSRRRRGCGSQTMRATAGRSVLQTISASNEPWLARGRITTRTKVLGCAPRYSVAGSGVPTPPPAQRQGHASAEHDFPPASPSLPSVNSRTRSAGHARGPERRRRPRWRRRRHGGVGSWLVGGSAPTRAAAPPMPTPAASRL
jgi:hypothetical protein